MAKNWMDKVADRTKREAERSARNYNKALESTERIRNKYNSALADLPVKGLTEGEKAIIYKAWIMLGYDKESASLIVYGNTYQHALI